VVHNLHAAAQGGGHHSLTHGEESTT
jgi:hypothetical protein